MGSIPELLAGDQMRPDDPLRWILIKREMPQSRVGHVDHLLIDQDTHGQRWWRSNAAANREIRRNIVGQMLDYAATAASVWSERDGVRRDF